MSDCACPKCVSLCSNPGWFSPDEARTAIAAGHAEKLMLDYLTSEPTIYVLCPASAGREKLRALNTGELFGGRSLFAAFISPRAKGQCVFLSDHGCAIHASGFKPKQCREAFGCTGKGPDNYAMAALWDNPEAQALVRSWMTQVGLEERELEECY